MTFTEKAFLFFILPTYGLWLLVRRREPAAVWLLLVASLVFYGHNHWALLPLLLVYIVADWAVALAIPATRFPRGMLALGVAFNLLVLAYYKYAPLLVRSTAGWAGYELSPDVLVEFADWVIPFGVSFYSFTGIAYMVDVYRGVHPAERSLPRYALSAAFFPHLVAGPILRPNEFLNRLRPGAMPTEPEAPLEAFGLLARGYVKKLFVADRIALAIDPFFAHVADGSTEGVWALPFVWLYAFQIYFDFSAYTDIARGLALLFGYRWPDNFHLPYLAANVAEFWHRWHTTLSRFLRDYLYIPLGGSRHGPVRTAANLMLTMLLGGLWHGASWSFLLWGGLHGAFLVAHRAWAGMAVRSRLAGLTGAAGLLWRGLCVAVTFHCVCLAWCFFRLTDFAESVACVRKWFAFDPDRLFVGGAAEPAVWVALLGYGGLSLATELGRRFAAWVDGRGMPTVEAGVLGFRWGAVVTLLVLAVALGPARSVQAFIYFQF